MKSLLLLVATLVLTACISTEHSSDKNPAPQALAVANSDGLVCKREKPTGSHRSMKICRRVADIERLEEDAELMNRRIRDQQSINRN